MKDINKNIFESLCQQISFENSVLMAIGCRIKDCESWVVTAVLLCHGVLYQFFTKKFLRDLYRCSMKWNLFFFQQSLHKNGHLGWNLYGHVRAQHECESLPPNQEASYESGLTIIDEFERETVTKEKCSENTQFMQSSFLFFVILS